jgi:hypothetical protein
MKTIRPLQILIILFTLSVFTTTVYSEVVRGRIVRNSPMGVYSVSAIPVTIRAANNVRTTPAFSGPDGMYYFNGVLPGVYFLELWVWGFNSQPVIYQIQVNYTTPYRIFDVSPITLP